MAVKLVNEGKIGNSLSFSDEASPNEPTLWIRSFHSGILTIEPNAGALIDDVAHTANKYLNDAKEFEKELRKFFLDADEIPFCAIRFNFNETDVFVTKENCDIKQIIKQYHINSKHRLEDINRNKVCFEDE